MKPAAAMLATATRPQDGSWDSALEALADVGERFLTALPSILVGVLMLLLFYLLGRGIRFGIRKFIYGRHKGWRLALVMGRIMHGMTVMLGLLVAAVIIFPTFTFAQLIQVLGIGSLAVGFAFRGILENYLAGILLLITQPFRIEDQIVHKEYEGTVDDIQTRATFIRTYDGRRIVIPNAELFTNAVIVNTAFANRRLEYDVGIGYGDDINRAKQLMLDAMKRVEGVLEEPAPDVLVFGFAASAVMIRVRWWIQPPRRRDSLESRDAVLSAIKRTLAEHGIDLPFPTQQVLFHDQTESTDGDRRQQREGWPAGQGEPPKPNSMASSLLRFARSAHKQQSRRMRNDQ